MEDLILPVRERLFFFLHVKVPSLHEKESVNNSNEFDDAVLKNLLTHYVVLENNVDKLICR